MMMRMIVDIRAPRLADPSPACPGTSPGRRVEPSNPVEPKARRFRRGSRYSTCSCSGGHVRAPLATGVRYRLNTSRRTRTFLSTRDSHSPSLSCSPHTYVLLPCDPMGQVPCDYAWCMLSRSTTYNDTRTSVQEPNKDAGRNVTIPPSRSSPAAHLLQLHGGASFPST